ncbi:ribonuclease H-like domain-containing protein [Tanacetum coccineum]
MDILYGLRKGSGGGGESEFHGRVVNVRGGGKSKPSDASLVKIEAPKELPKVSLVNESLKKLKFHLARFDNVVKIRTTPDACTEESLKDIFNVFDRDLLNEIMEVQTVFNQMDAVVQQFSVDKQCLKIAKKELLLENDRLLQQIMSQEVLLTVMNSMSLIGESVNMDGKRKETCNLEAELLKSQNAFNNLLKRYSQLEKHCISLEASIQLNQEIFQKDESCNNQNALEIPEFFEKNDLKAQLQDKDSTICKLKDIIKSMREKSKEENVNYDYGEIVTKNVELENSMAKLSSENERLCNEINHVKQVFKEQFDSIKKTRVRTKEQSDSLIDKLNLKSAKNEDLKAQIQDKVFVITSLKNDLRKLKGKEIVDIAAQTPSAHTIVPGMFKLDLEPLAPRLLQNREMHIAYLKYTQEQADILQELFEQAKAKQPLDKELDFACKHAQRIQELLVYVQDTCPNAIKLSAKKVAITPKNYVKKVKFVEPLTSSSNIKQVESSTTYDSNKPVLSPTGLKCSTSNCGSKPTSNKKNDMISQPPSRNMKNKVEAQPRKVNKKNRVVEPICDVNVKHSQLNANSEPICATCKKSLFDDVHDKCLLDFVENVNSRAKSTKKHKKQNIWKPTGHVFTEVGLKITSANVVPPKKTTSHSVETQKPELKVYSRKPKNVKNVGSSKKAKIVESKNANHSKPNHTWGSNATDIPSSSSLVMTGCPDYSLVFRLRMFETYDREPLSAHELSCALGESKKSSYQPKAEDTNREKLYLLHMDLCGPMRVASINGKMYILVIVDDYSRFTWVRFLRTKDEAPEAIIKCIKNIQVHLNATVRNVRTDNGTRFVNQTLREFYENVGISHQTSVARTPHQNGFYNKTPYELMQDKKLDLSFFHVFGALCYPTNDNDDLVQEAAASRAVVLADSPVSTSIYQDAPS